MRYALLVGVLTFLITIPWGEWFIAFLRAHGIGKRIRVEGPSSHQVKMGTPTMGGILFLTPVALAGIALYAASRGEQAGGWMLLLLGTLVAYAALGALDDAEGLTRHSDTTLATQIGILGRYMFLMQLAIALAVAAALYYGLEQREITLLGQTIPLGIWYVPVAAFLIVSIVNAVNLTDGLDGLAGGTAALAFAAYGVIAFWQGMPTLVAFCLAVVGALLAFLWYNTHPARVIMGGIGSLTLGGLLAVIALLMRDLLALVVISALFIAVELSVVLQVTYFKYTRRRFGAGRRIFKMAPLHHHFELSGWTEVQVVQRFWLVGAVAAMAGVALALWQSVR